MRSLIEGDPEVSGMDGFVKLTVETTPGREPVVSCYGLTPHKALALAKKLEAAALVMMAPNVRSLTLETARKPRRRKT